MTDIEFHRGWAMLIVQPWARDYAYDEARESVIIRLFRQHCGSYDGGAWLRRIEWWIAHESSWPTIPQMLGLLRRYQPDPKPVALLPDASRHGDGGPWRLVIQTWVRGEGPIHKIAGRILPAWIRDHPDDAFAIGTWATWRQGERGTGRPDNGHY